MIKTRQSTAPAFRFTDEEMEIAKGTDLPDLWSAASILCDGCTDDGFIDFRGWLIAQGREVYMAALKDPDSLADVPVYGGCCFETLSYVGDYAYEKLTGQDSYDRFDCSAYQALVEELKKDIVYGEGIDYPYTWSETAAYLPRLCAKHMTPEELAWRINCHNDTWNVTSPDIQSARATAEKSNGVLFVDKKLRQKIREKKMAHGHKANDHEPKLNNL